MATLKYTRTDKAELNCQSGYLLLVAFNIPPERAGQIQKCSEKSASLI